MADENSSIVVGADAKSVVVDGLLLLCTDVDYPADMHVMRWNPADLKCKGHIERKTGDSHGFSDFTVFVPYLEAWQRAKIAHDELEAKRRALVSQAQKDEAEARVAAEAARDARKPLHDALTALGRTDHEIIKAMEALLAAEGKLPADLVEQRRAWREIAKAEKGRKPT